jgi:hypothetical protein
MAVDLEGAEIEAMMWKPTGELRWFNDEPGSGAQLQQLWERVTGERQWRPVPTVWRPLASNRA